MKRILALVSLGLLLLACGPVEKEVAVSSVSLNKSSAELTVGETLRLSATVSPADATDKTVTWSSSSSSVATVSPSGEVTAVAVGSANITASAGGKSASCAVTVIKPTVSVTSVTLDKERLDLTVGGTAKLTATVAPADANDKSVTWESSDASVATVDSDGNVKALKGGTSTVTAKSGGKSASALVDVMDITPTEVSVEAEGGDIKVKVTADRQFSVKSKPDWVKEKSLTNKEYTFTVEANPQTTERSGSIVISDASGTSLTCTVKQAGKDVFEISPTEVSMESGGGTFEVKVTATRSYHISSTPEWVKQKSLKDNVYTFEAEANTDTKERSGVIVICDDLGTCLPCTVKQDGADVFRISPDNVEFDAEGGTFEVTVTATSSYHISSKPEWVTLKSRKDDVYTFEVGFNSSESSRSDVIVICDDKGTCLSCTVKQEGVKPFGVSPTQVNVGYKGGTFDITVTSSYGYHLNSKPDWVTEKSVKDKVHTFEVGANSLSDTRSGAITFCDDKGTCLSVTVRQEGDPDAINWDLEFYHNPLLMCFTCAGSYGYRVYKNAIDEAFSQLSKRPLVINMHMWDSAELPGLNVLENRYGINSPLVSIIDGRRRVPEYFNHKDLLIESVKEYVAETEANYPVTSAIGFESSFGGQRLYVDLKLYLKQGGNYKVSVFVTESGVIGGQYDEEYGYIEDFCHDDIARVAMTSIDGDAFTATARSVKELHYDATVSKDCKKENLRVMVIVQRAYGSQTKITDGEYDYGDYYVDNCASGKVGTVVSPVFLSWAGGGNEDVTNGEPVNW